MRERWGQLVGEGHHMPWAAHAHVCPKLTVWGVMVGTRAHRWWAALLLPLHNPGRHVCKRGEGREGGRDPYGHGSPLCVYVTVW